MPGGKIWRIQPGKITQVYLEPIPTAHLSLKDLPALKAQAAQQMEAVLRERDLKFR